MIIRPRTPEDMPGLLEALEAVHKADVYPVIWPKDPADWLTPASLIGVRVAERDGGIVGHVGVATGELPEAMAELVPTTRLAWVTRLFVAPQARGANLGAALLDTAKAIAGEHDRRLILDVESTATKAIALYERQGWRHVHSATGNWLAPDGKPARLRYYLSPDA